MPTKSIIKLKKIRSRGPLAEKAYAILKEAIIQGQFAPGTWLQEEQITKALGTSRTPVREAFNRLKSDGFIEVMPRKGAYIIELSDTELDDLFEAREVIETTFFVRSARKLPRNQIIKLREALVTSEKAMNDARTDPEGWHVERRHYLKADRELHDSLIAATENKYWEKLYLNIRDRIEMYGNQLSLDETWFKLAIRDHYAIIDAILDQQYDVGKSAMATHIQNVRQGIDRIRQASSEYRKRQPRA